MSGKCDIISDFGDELIAGKLLCVMPVPRLLLSQRSGVIGHARIYPADSIDFEPLRIVSTPEYEWREIERRGYSESLGWSKSAATQLGMSSYDGHALIAFPINFPWDRFLDGDHDFHKDVLRQASEIAEGALDLIRFDYCRLDLPATLPGSAGSFNDRNSFSSAIFFDSHNCEAYMIGSEILTHMVSAGIGLEISGHVEFPALGRGEVGMHARMALSLLSQAMEANSLTSKFVQSMSLLDFLHVPDKFERMKEVKKSVAAHVARDANHYNRILDRFRELTGRTFEGREIGIRTLLVHHGERLENLVSTQVDQRKLFQELQGYIGKMIHDFIEMSDGSWDDVVAYREDRRAALFA